MLVSGYARIFIRETHLRNYEDEDDYLWRDRRDERKRECRSRKSRRRKADENSTEWEDVGAEFRGMLYDAFRSARDNLRKKGNSFYLGK